MWSVLVALNLVTKYPQRAFSGISFPVRTGDISKFEKRNDLSINVFGYEKRDLYFLHLNKERGLKHVDILVFNRARNLALL